MSKVTLISTKKTATWESWTELRSRNDPNMNRLTMTQSEALAIFQQVVTAGTVEDAVQFLRTTLPTRGVFTYWLGQVGHRQDVRLGKGKGLTAYVRAVVESLCSRKPVDEMPSEREEEQEMGKKRDQPGVIIRKSKAGKISEPVKPGPDYPIPVNERSIQPTRNEASDSTLNGPQEVQASQSNDSPTADTVPEEKPPMGRLQEYALKTLLTYADCAVQQSEMGVLDVLARNFEGKAMMNFWLWRVGYGDLVRRTQNKDFLDSIRIISREIYRDMRRTVGKPVSRW